MSAFVAAARELLHSGDALVRGEALVGVGAVAPECPELVGDLIAIMTTAAADGDEIGAAWAAHALGKHGAHAEAAIPLLIERLEKDAWQPAAWALGAMGEGARPAVPSLVATLRRRLVASPTSTAEPVTDVAAWEAELWRSGCEALHEIDPDGGHLEALLHDAAEAGRPDLAEAVLFFALSPGERDTYPLTYLVSQMGERRFDGPERERMETRLKVMMTEGSPVCERFATVSAAAGSWFTRRRLDRTAADLGCE